MSRNQSVIGDYDKKLREAGAEIDRLNNRLRGEISEKDRLAQDYQQLMYQNSRLPLLEKENQDLKERSKEINFYQRQTAEYENKIALMSSELERLKGAADHSKAARAEIDQLRNQLASMKAELDRIDGSWNERHINEINRINTEFERRVVTLVQEKDKEGRGRLSDSEKEINRLRGILSTLSQENEVLKAQNN